MKDRLLITVFVSPCHANFIRVSHVELQREMEREPEEQRKIDQLRSAIKGLHAAAAAGVVPSKTAGARSVLLILGLFIAIADVTFAEQTPRRRWRGTRRPSTS